MAKKLQIFVSSTYKDLIAERQAAVEAILAAGHIPAGMELFTAGDESQLETIYRWIDESDIFMLILGGRYGSIEKKSGKSYTHLEYEHALNSGKATFAVVMQEDALNARVKTSGKDVLELENRAKYEDFKKIVLEKMCMFFHDHKDIKLAFHTTVIRLQKEREFKGWVSGAEVVNNSTINTEIARLSQENSELRSKLQAAGKKAEEAAMFGGLTFSELWETLVSLELPIPAELDPACPKHNLGDLFYQFQNLFCVGLNDERLDPIGKFVFFNLGAGLMPFGLVEIVDTTGVFVNSCQQMRATDAGHQFLARFAHSIAKANQIQPENLPNKTQKNTVNT